MSANRSKWEFDTGPVTPENYCGCQRPPRVCIQPIEHRLRRTATGEVIFRCEEGMTRLV